MKRHFISLALAVVIALTLCACSVPPTARTPAPSPAESAPAASDTHAGAQANAADGNAPPAAPLRTLTTSVWGGANSSGYYAFATPSNRFNVGYRLDFATGTQQYLCRIPGCDHTQETCSAVFQPDAQMRDGTILADEDKLYWISRTGGHMTSLDGKPTRPCVQVSDLDGANRRVLFTLDEGSFLREVPVVTDGTTMYLVRLLSSTSPTVHDTRLLVGVDMQTGKIGLQYELTGINPQFLGAYQGKLLFVETTLTPDCPEQPRYRMYNEISNENALQPYMRSSLFTVTTDGMQRETLYTTKSAGEAFTYDNGMLYQIGQQENTLTATDLSTGVTATLAENLPAACFIDSLWRDYVLLCDLNSKDVAQRTVYVLNKATGELRKSPFSQTQTLGISPVLYETDRDFLVVSGLTPGKKSWTEPGQSEQTVDSFRVEYALINKQAFFEGRPEYRVIALLPELQDWMH